MIGQPSRPVAPSTPSPWVARSSRSSVLFLLALTLVALAIGAGFLLWSMGHQPQLMPAQLMTPRRWLGD